MCVAGWLDPNHYDPWTAFHGQVWQAGGAALLAGWIAVRCWRSAETYSVPAAALVIGLGALIPWLQWWAGIVLFLGDAWIVSLYWLAAAMAVTTGFNFSRQFGLRRLVDVIAAMLIVSGLLCAWFAFIQLLELDYLEFFSIGIRPDGRVVANLAQPNQLGVMLVMAAVGVGWLHATQHIRAAVALAAVAFLFVPIMLTGSRAAWLIAPGTLLWLAIGGWSRTQPMTLRKTASVLAAVAAGFLAAVALAQLIKGATEQAVAGRALESIVVTGQRPAHWAMMFEASLRRPWSGYGWNQVIAAQYDVAPDFPATLEIIGSSHNVPLDFMVSIGAIPGLLMIAAIALWIGRLLCRVRSLESVYGAALILPILAYAVVEFPTEYTYFLLPLGLLLGGLQQHQPVATKSHLIIAAPAWAALVSIAALAVGLAWTVVDYMKLEANFRNFRFEQARFKNAPTQPEPVQLLTQLDAFLRFARSPDTDGMTSQQIEEFAAVGRRFPNWTVLTRWAAALARNGQPEAATAVLSRICKTHPVAVCEAARTQWIALGRQSAAIAAASWPEAATPR
jgi:Virulence factor membrane-bound polymerase, C-terminal/O-Antigen ligase